MTQGPRWPRRRRYEPFRRSARRCASRIRTCARGISRKSPAATALEDALREAERCLLCPDQPCVARLPGRHRHSRLHPEDQRRRTSAAPTTSSPRPICCRRSAAASARRRTSARASARSARRWSRSRSAGSSASSATRPSREGWINIPYIEPTRFKRRHRRLRPRRHGLRRRHGQGRLRRHRLRGVPRARRRAEVRHPRFPPAQHGDRRRDRQAAQARRQVRMQHAGRAAVHRSSR